MDQVRLQEMIDARRLDSAIYTLMRVVMRLELEKSRQRPWSVCAIPYPAQGCNDAEVLTALNMNLSVP